MIRIALLSVLTLVGIAITAGDASAQFRRGGRGGGGGGYISPSYGYGNGYGNSYYGNTMPGITIPGTNYTIPGTSYGNNYGSSYGSPYGSGYGNYGSQYPSQYQSGYRSGSYYNTVPYYTTPESSIAPASYYSPSDTSQIAMLTVQVPTGDAQVWLNDTLVTTTGMDRQFQSPPLDPAKNYSYTIKVRWTDDGKVVEKTKDVKVEPGKTSTVSFR